MLETKSELAGAFIGDGHSFNYKRKDRPHYRKGICFTGDIEKEKSYFQYLSNHLQHLFDVKSYIYKVKERSKGCLRLYLKSDEVYQDFVSNGLIPKNKVPDWVIPKEFIRGVFDTDGCVYKHSDGHMEINFKGKQHWLIEWIHSKLPFLGIKVGRLCPAQNNQLRFRICGKQNIINFFDIISPANIKHQLRFKKYLSTGETAKGSQSRIAQF